MISDELKNHFCAKIYKHFYFLIYQIYNKNKKLSEIQRVLNVDPQGFEPRQTEPKSGVLPLHHGSSVLSGANIQTLSLTTKSFFCFFIN